MAALLCAHESDRSLTGVRAATQVFGSASDIQAIKSQTPACMNTPESRGMRRDAFVDLAKRARSGVMIHLPLWLLVGMTHGLAAALPLVFWGQTVLFATAMTLRLLFERRLAQHSVDRPLAAVAFRTLLLWSPFQWGVVGALALFWPAMQPMEMPLLFILAGVAAAGGMALAIDPIVRLFYPLLTAAPPALMLLMVPSTTSLYVSCVAVVFVVYVVRASKSVYNDYWSAVCARVELERHTHELEKLSITDALTQVHNRQFLDRQLAVAWAHAGQDINSMSLIMIDIDHFKRINDTHGHPFGDACLQAVAQALKESLKRPGDLVARYGGEEFLVLLPGATQEGAAAVASRLHQAVGTIALAHGGEPVRITCSIGVHTIASVGNCTVAAALSMVDQALYAAKRQGRNRVVMAGV